MDDVPSAQTEAPILTSSPAPPVPPPRRGSRVLLLLGVGGGGLLLCGLLAVWSLIEVIAHGDNPASWDPPPLHTAAPSPAPTRSLAAASATPLAPSPPPIVALVPTDPIPSEEPFTGPLPTDTPLSPTSPPAPPTSPPAPLTRLPDAAQPLAGRRIALDPGHGPREDLGAVYVDPTSGRLILSEDVVNLDVAKRTRALLEARGASVFLTREATDDFTTPWPADPNGDGIKGGAADDLQWRIDEMNAFGAEVFLCIHANSHANPAKRKGIQGLACLTDDCATPKQNRLVALLALDHLESELAAIGYPITNRELRNDMFSDGPGDPEGHLFISGPAELPKHPRAIAMPGALIEALYITSPEEVAQLLQPTVRDANARAYAGALEEYLLNPAPTP